MSEVENTSIIWNLNGNEFEIFHPYKIYWSKENITKLDLLQYYKNIASTILPYLKNRPVTLHYFPRGIQGFSFYRRDFTGKDINKKLFRTVPYKEVSQHKIIQVPLIDSTAALLWLVSKGCIEFHLWSSKIPKYTNPDLAIFDLDINKNTDFKNVLKASLYLKELLSEMNLKGYPKTTGGTGLHVYVPIIAEYSFKQVKEWVKTTGILLEKKFPNLISTQRKSGKTHTSNKVTIDYLQNVISRNTAAPYTVRAYPNAPVSTPLTWKEIEKGGFLPKDFNINNIPERISKLGDLFHEVLTNKQKLFIN